MRAAVLEELVDGAVPVLHERDAPVPGDGEVVVRLVAADVQPLDRQIARGGFPGAGPVPMVAGVSGVAATDDGAVHVVLAEMTGMGLHRDGCFADAFVCRPDQLVPLPQGVDPVQAAAAANAGMHARRAVEQVLAVGPEDRLLVLGASGAFGRAAVQLAVALGVPAVAAARDIERVPSLPGVSPVELDADDVDAFVAGVMAATDGRGATAVLDPLGGPWTSAAVRACASDARHVVLGNQAGAVAPVLVPLLLAREHRIVGMNGFRIAPDEQRRLMAVSLADLATGTTAADVGAVLPLARVEQAYAGTGPAAGRGRTVIVP